MEKTRFGISAALMAAIVCLLSYYGGYVIAGVMIGYVLLMEQSAFLKRIALKVLAVMLAFSLLNTVIYLIPNILSLIESAIYIFDEFAYGSEIYHNGFVRFMDFLASVLSTAKMVVMLLMGVFALLGKELKLPGLDQLLNKLTEKQAV